jgi:hypothetical protein
MKKKTIFEFFFQTAAEVGPVDPHMERQVETINKLVTSYMQIVAKMTRDYIPKTIMYHIVQNVRKYSSIFDSFCLDFSYKNLLLKNY